MDDSMRKDIFKQVPLYRFLQLCNEETLTGTPKILDCGAGGDQPPLSLFHSYGYETMGIEFDPDQVEKANAYGLMRDQSLNILLGDMTKLDYEDNAFDFVYSYNSIFHMKKESIQIAINELKRVLKPNGLMFVNFLSVDDFRCGEGPDLGDNQYEQMDDTPVIHSYFDYDEAEHYFGDMALVIKERRIDRKSVVLGKIVYKGCGRII